MKARVGRVYRWCAIDRPVPKDVASAREMSYTARIQRSVSSMASRCRKPLAMPLFRVTATGHELHAHDGMEVVPHPI